MKKNAFTLIEIIATVAILCIIFLFITPKMVELINNSQNQNKEQVEQKLVSAAREYTTNYNNRFASSFIIVGTIDYINASTLIDNGLIDEEDVIDLNTNISSVRVKVELTANDKFTYTVVYSS